MGTFFARAGGIAAVLVPVVIWVAIILLFVAAGGDSGPGSPGRTVFFLAIGVIAPLLMALALIGAWILFARIGWRLAPIVLAPMILLCALVAYLSFELGTLVIFSESPPPRTREMIAAWGYAAIFALTILFGIQQIQFRRAGGGLWIASGILYLLVSLFSCPAWISVAVDLGGAAGIRGPAGLPRLGILPLLSILIGTMLLLPFASICHGIALLLTAPRLRA